MHTRTLEGKHRREPYVTAEADNIVNHEAGAVCNTVVCVYVIISLPEATLSRMECGSEETVKTKRLI